MFFQLVMERDMSLHPRFIGPNYRQHLVSNLINEVEGTYSEQHGFVVKISDIHIMGSGFIPSGTGFPSFHVRYTGLVFKAFKGEILEAVVTEVNRFGFVAEAGPAQIFVSNQLFPVAMQFQSGDNRSYSSSDGSIRIQMETEVRLKIIGTNVENNAMLCVGTIQDNFLGVIRDPGAA